MSQTFFLSHGFLFPHVADSAKLNKLFPIGKTRISMKKSTGNSKELDAWIKKQMAPMLRRPDDPKQVPGYNYISYGWDSINGPYCDHDDFSSNVSTAHDLSPPLPQQQTHRFFPYILSLGVVLCITCIFELLMTSK
ncbi:hypothetical protein A2U01_0034311, partial [Trifolium medium]|nr:hypothetical protein [Trifolium medium]